MNDNQPEPLEPTEPGGEMEHQDPRHADDLEAQGEAEAGETDLGGEPDRSFDPSEVEASRAREQGLGVGQRELDLQRDATGADSSEHFGQMESEGGRRGEGSTDVEHGESRKGGVEQP